MSRDSLTKQRDLSASGAEPGVPIIRNVTIEERRRLVAEALNVGNPGNNARNLPPVCDPCRECQIELSIDDIHLYEHNPRRTDNLRFAEIKASVRAGGIRNPLTVTRRPGEEHFIVESGGNTRLRAMKVLWLETNDVRFQKLLVIFRPWRSETHVLVAHLVENEVRGEVRFWDKANGIAALKARLEVDKGCELSIRELEEEMRAAGLVVNTTTLVHSLYAIRRLQSLGDAVPELSGLDVKSIQPRLNRLKRFAQKRSDLSEDDLYEAVFEPVFKAAADRWHESGRFSAVEVCRECEIALANVLGQAVEVLQSTLLGASGISVSGGGDAIVGAGSSDDPDCRMFGNGGSNGVAIGDPTDPDRGVASGPSDFECSSCSSTEGLRSIGQQVLDLAQLMGIGDWVLIKPGALYGFVIKAPTRSAESLLSLSAQRGLRLLQIVSGKVEGDESSDDALVRWLIDPRDQTATGFLDVVRLVRSAVAGESADSSGDPVSVRIGGR